VSRTTSTRAKQLESEGQVQAEENAEQSKLIALMEWARNKFLEKQERQQVSEAAKVQSLENRLYEYEEEFKKFAHDQRSVLEKQEKVLQSQGDAINEILSILRQNNEDAVKSV